LKKAIIPLRDLCETVKKEMEADDLSGDWVHGLNHVKRVYNNLLFLLKCCEGIPFKFNPEIIERLKIAIIFHDVKRGNPGSCGDHAVAGAKFFKAQRIRSLNAEDVKAIAFAITNHNKGIKNLKPKVLEGATQDEKDLLQLLVVMDGMDSLGDVGYLRVLQWYGWKGEKFSLLGDISSDVLCDVLACKYSPEQVAALNLKDAGEILPHLVHDCYIFAEMLEPIEPLLPSDFLTEIDRRWTELRENIIKLIEMKRKNEKSSCILED
jgi:hypothetical protein